MLSSKFPWSIQPADPAPTLFPQRFFSSSLLSVWSRTENGSIETAGKALSLGTSPLLGGTKLWNHAAFPSSRTWNGQSWAQRMGLDLPPKAIPRGFVCSTGLCCGELVCAFGGCWSIALLHVSMTAARWDISSMQQNRSERVVGLLFFPPETTNVSKSEKIINEITKCCAQQLFQTHAARAGLLPAVQGRCANPHAGLSLAHEQLSLVDILHPTPAVCKRLWLKMSTATADHWVWRSPPLHSGILLNHPRVLVELCCEIYQSLSPKHPHLSTMTHGVRDWTWAEKHTETLKTG